MRIDGRVFCLAGVRCFGCASARNVRVPAMPSPCNPWARWKRRSAATVAASNRPSTRFAASPYGRSRNSSDATSQPTRPRDSTRCPSSGVPSLPSLQRVAIPSFAVALIRWFRWNVSNAFRVNGPFIPSTAPA